MADTHEQMASLLEAIGLAVQGKAQAACEAGAAALRAQAQTQEELRQWAIYCFNKYGHDAHLYNGLAKMAGMEP